MCDSSYTLRIYFFWNMWNVVLTHAYLPYRLLRKWAGFDITSSGEEMSSALARIQVCGCVWSHLCVKYIWETWWWEQMRTCRWSGVLERLTCLPWCVYLTVISQESSTCYLHGSYVDRWKTLSPQSNIQLLIQAAILNWKKFGITKHKDIFNKTTILLFESGSSPAWLERGLWKTH